MATKITELPTDAVPDGADLIPFVDLDAVRTEAVSVDNLAATPSFATRYQSLDADLTTLAGGAIPANLTVALDAEYSRIDNTARNAVALMTGRKLLNDTDISRARVSTSTASAMYLDTGPSAIANLVGASTMDDPTNTFTTPGAHGFALNDRVVFQNLPGGSGINAGVVYYIKSTPTATTFTISATAGGATNDLTASGAVDVYKDWPVGYDPFTTAGVDTGLYLFRKAVAMQGDPNFPRYTYAKAADNRNELTVEIDITGTEIDVVLRNPGTNAMYHVIYVDGIPVADVIYADFTGLGIATGSLGRIHIAFPVLGTYRITVEMTGSGNPEFARIDANFGATTAKPIDVADEPFAMMVGDSFTEGTGAGPAYGIVPWLSAFTGLLDLREFGDGGTGYNEAGPRTSLVSRYVTDIINRAPDICIIALGLNDRDDYIASPTTVLTSITTVWDGIIAALPNTLLVIVGPFSPKGAGFQLPSLEALDADMAEAAALRQLRYISPVAEGWITGSGRVGATTGNGNADVFISTDGTHPSAAGHKYLAWRLAGHLASLT